MSGFPTTTWTVIREAARSSAGAQGELVGRYRPAVVRYARKRGVDEAEAEDVAQEVFLALLEPAFLERADASKGRFRSLVLAITTFVLNGRRAHRSALKRGGGRAPVSLDATSIDALVASREREPEFDREWLALLLAESFRRLRRENEPHADSLEAFLVQGLTHAQIAAKLGKTEAAVRNAVSRGRQRLVEILRGEVARYASSEDEFEEEVRYLEGLFGRA